MTPLLGVTHTPSGQTAPAGYDGQTSVPVGAPQAVEALRLFVAEHFDGSLSRCIELDRLLWEVRLSQRHIPEMLHYEGKVQSALAPPLLNHLDLADLGL